MENSETKQTSSQSRQMKALPLYQVVQTEKTDRKIDGTNTENTMSNQILSPIVDGTNTENTMSNQILSPIVWDGIIIPQRIRFLEF
jgi:hypothetical protein